MQVRLAVAADDPEIADLLQRIAMPGGIRMACRYEPSFFSALAAEGCNPRVLVAEKAGRIVGVGSLTTRRVYLGGQPAEVGYLASLRLDPQVRGTNLLARGYRLLAELNRQEPRLPFALTSIMRGNRPAIDLLTGGRAGLPIYRLLAGYRTAVLPVLRRYGLPHDSTVLDGREAGNDAVLHCQERYGRQKDLFTVHSRDELATGTGMLQGMRPEDFLVAFRGADPVGCVALWDQASFRKLEVREYPPGMRLAARLDRAVARFTGGPVLPPAGVPFAPLYLSCVAVLDNDPEVFRILLRAALNRTWERQRRLLVAGFFENDRLCRCLDAFLHIPMLSNIYTVTWDGAAGPLVGTDRECYLDAGSL